jgi:uncharacterized membrane protein
MKTVMAPAAEPSARAPEPGSEPGRRSRLALAGFMIVAGILHFVVPGFYERIVPRRLGNRRAVVYWSGVAEVLCGTLVALPRTKRLGAWLTLVVLVAVYPANIQMAIDAGRPVDAFTAGVWLRLPLQVPLWAWAYRRATR